MQPSEGGRHILACLQAEGFTATCTPGWKDTRYFAAHSDLLCGFDAPEIDAGDT
jgi:hypothetical protein